MGTIYSVAVTAVGELAEAFAEEGILVFFGPDAPEELHEFAILTDHESGPSRPVVTGDQVEIDGTGYEVLCVGNVANQNLAELGHLVVKFNGLTEPELPGDVSVPSGPAPQIDPGAVVSIRGRND